MPISPAASPNTSPPPAPQQTQAGYEEQSVYTPQAVPSKGFNPALLASVAVPVTLLALFALRQKGRGFVLDHLKNIAKTIPNASENQVTKGAEDFLTQLSKDKSVPFLAYLKAGWESILPESWSKLKQSIPKTGSPTEILKSLFKDKDPLTDLAAEGLLGSLKTFTRAAS